MRPSPAQPQALPALAFQFGRCRSPHQICSWEPEAGPDGRGSENIPVPYTELTNAQLIPEPPQLLGMGKMEPVIQDHLPLEANARAE